MKCHTPNTGLVVPPPLQGASAERGRGRTNRHWIRSWEDWNVMEEHGERFGRPGGLGVGKQLPNYSVRAPFNGTL